MFGPRLPGLIPQASVTLPESAESAPWRAALAVELMQHHAERDGCFRRDAHRVAMQLDAPVVRRKHFLDHRQQVGRIPAFARQEVVGAAQREQAFDEFRAHVALDAAAADGLRRERLHGRHVFLTR